MVSVFINDAFKKYLLRQTPPVRARIRQKFEFLEIGYWDGGLKVKKIKGSGGEKAVFEARLDRAQRIIFTLGRESGEQADAPITLVYIWGIVGHDDIAHKSNAVPRDAPFLHFQPYHDAFIEDGAFENLDAACYTQEDISQKIVEDSGSQKWHFLHAENWDRIEKYRQQDFELDLYLTPAQQGVLNRPLPILISGTAGSGKTTLSIYYLLKLSLCKQRKIFITYNDHLKNYAQKLFSALINATPLQQEMVYPDFFTFKEYCSAMVQSSRRGFHPQREVTLDKFITLTASLQKTGKHDLPLIWEEIRSIIKGALPQLDIDIFRRAVAALAKPPVGAQITTALGQQLLLLSNLASMHKAQEISRRLLAMDLQTLALNLPPCLETRSGHLLTALEKILQFLSKERESTQRRYLSFVDYEALGRKKAPNFHMDRKQVYQIFEWYQDKLDREQLWDELDLSREALQVVKAKAGDEYGYDLVVCDEVQDLTDIQHELFFHIARNPLNVLLCGDSKQIINPSGFRWEELKRHFFERNLPVPDLTYLNLNFRSSGSIVELSNLLLEIKSRLLGVRAEEIKEDWKYKGRPPVVVQQLDERRVLQSIRETGARRTILVRNEEEKRQLQQLLETELVFTINEAKGMEFDTVLVWKFAADLQTKDIWQVILRQSSQEVHQALVRHEINLLYVAITRAQKDLLIYDGKQPSQIWQCDLLRDHVYHSDDLDYIGNIWQVVSTPEEWRQQGEYFFERQYYRAAMECFKNAGAEQRLLAASALDAEKRGQFESAALSFEKLGEWPRAAECHEKCGRLQQAFDIWIKLNKKRRAMSAHLKLLEQEGQFKQLAELYLTKREYAKAYHYFTRACEWEQAAVVASKKLKKPVQAAENFARAGSYAVAARLYQKMKQPEQAAELWEKAGELDAAEKIWRRLGKKEALLAFYQRSGNQARLLDIYVKNRDLEHAVKALKRLPDAGDLQAEGHTYLEQRKYFAALVRFIVIDDRPNIAACYLKLRDYPKAGAYYGAAGMHFEAGIAYQKARDWEKAFHAFIQADEEKKNDFVQARKALYRLPSALVMRIAEQLYRQRKYMEAGVCFRAVDNYVMAGVCAFDAGLRDQALIYWQSGIVSAQFLEGIAEFCLARRQVEWLAPFLLQQPVESFFEHFIRFEVSGLPEDESCFMRLMDEYFKTPRPQTELDKWIALLHQYPENPYVIDKLLDYHEKSTRYNQYFEYIDYLLKKKKININRLAAEWRRNVDALTAAPSEIAAIKLYAINKKTEFNRMLAQLQPSRNNYRLFAESDHYEKVVDLMVDIGLYDRARWLLINRQEWLKAAQLAEKLNHIDDAALYYNLAGKAGKSAELYAQIGKFRRAGDVYFADREYQRALAMYLKVGKTTAKLAETYEKLGKYAEAAGIWKQLNRLGRYRRCMAKLTPGLFD